VSYDTIVRNGRWFDGTGAPSAVRNIGIRDGHVVAVTPHALDETECPQIIDATGKWVLPGMLDIHTHYDVEVLNGPSLSESLRHGVTTVMLGSCSLSTVHVGGVDAGDLFGRVEAIPREHVIGAVDQHKTWTNCEEYVAALEALPLGPNLAAFIGHSDMRTATMGLARATQKNQRPTRSEQAQMERMLFEALDAGFVGMSSQQLLFDKLDGNTCRSRTLPSTYAKPRELRRLKSRLRRTGRVLQSGPDIENPLNPRISGRPVAGHLPPAAEDQPAVGGRRQGQPVRHPNDGPGCAAGESAGRQLPLAASAGPVRGVRRRHRPGDLRGVRRRRRGTAPVRRGGTQRAAHLRNMAFYNMGLRLLRHVLDAEKADSPFMTIEQAVHRLTGELADWYRIDAGHLRIGDRADLVVVDPDRLDSSLAPTPRRVSNGTAACPAW
jgi:N-acyl-D-aspartate/D-glutamate deacylase